MYGLEFTLTPTLSGRRGLVLTRKSRSRRRCTEEKLINNMFELSSSDSRHDWSFLSLFACLRSWRLRYCYDPRKLKMELQCFLYRGIDDKRENSPKKTGSRTLLRLAGSASRICAIWYCPTLPHLWVLLRAGGFPCLRCWETTCMIVMPYRVARVSLYRFSERPDTPWKSIEQKVLERRSAF